LLRHYLLDLRNELLVSLGEFVHENESEGVAGAEQGKVSLFNRLLGLVLLLEPIPELDEII